MAAPRTIAELLAAASARLGTSDSPRLDAEVLLAHALGCARSALYSAPERVPPASCAARFATLLGERAHGRPIAHLTGRAEFWSLALAVNEAVLVPRPETELLVETALTLIGTEHAARVVDLGTGSGAIACALAHERPRARIVASERSAAALAVAVHNFRSGHGAPVAALLGHWLRPFAPDSFDVVVANPPYIGLEERPTLAPGLAYEPPAALFAGADGLADVREIVRDAPRVLGAGGWLVLEHGYRQGAAVRRLLAARGFDAIDTRCDLAGHERVTLGRA